ncbi:HAD family hydrolase [Kocuria coralli]|uniref:HAD family hydrolase n=1 Tax=Kocuria coralli TaxID=1461025 RepID=A0A5J5KYM4_9MICC|nr:HAD-IA family hydrolase [Kocuria coralli]KAA9394632.1 HAD family hydrolase [Kocuria coralli]
MRFEVDAILFDIDGTLIDSTPAVNRSWTTWAKSRGFDADAVLAVCHGRRSTDTLSDLLPEGEVAEAAAEVYALEMAELDSVVALPRAGELLASLPPSRWAAVTSGPRGLMQARLAAAGIPVPETLVTAEDVVVGKPDPEGYRKAAEILGVDPARCLVVEDAPAGLKAGRASGARVLAVATSHDAVELTDADAVVADLTAVSVTAGDAGLTVAVAEAPVG